MNINLHTWLPCLPTILELLAPLYINGVSIIIYIYIYIINFITYVIIVAVQCCYTVQKNHLWPQQHADAGHHCRLSASTEHPPFVD